MFSIKRVPRAEWAQQRLMGPGSFVIDENDVIGSWNGTSYIASSADTSYTAAQLAALAAAGGLTPLATYIPSDAVPPYQLWARSASEFGTPTGGDLVEVQYSGATGSIVEV